jgi:hypothetical protein
MQINPILVSLNAVSNASSSDIYAKNIHALCVSTFVLSVCKQVLPSMLYVQQEVEFILHCLYRRHALCRGRAICYILEEWIQI